MTGIDLTVILGGGVVIALLACYFLALDRAAGTRPDGGVQDVTVTVRGGYFPEVVRIRQGAPVRLVFDRQEAGDCSSRVIFPDLKLSASLPAFATTTIDFTPRTAGEFPFTCATDAVGGRLVVEPAGHDAAAATGDLPRAANPTLTPAVGGRSPR